MAENSKIEWTNHTFNPWWGCTKVSAGCKNCYAETLSNRFGDWWGPESERRFFGDKHWNEPLKWNRKAEKLGVRHKVFCGSMCDVFEDYPGLEEQRGRLGLLIKNTPNLDWLLLTKRPENVFNMCADLWWVYHETDEISPYIPENVWLGTSVENQEQANLRIPELLKIPAKVRFLSCEPLLGRINLSDVRAKPFDKELTYSGMIRGIHWIIVGGESGTNARPMHPDWARELRDDCKEANVAYFFKQWGEWIMDNNLTFDKGQKPTELFIKIGKKKAGDLLDGRQYHEFPRD